MSGKTQIIGNESIILNSNLLNIRNMSEDEFIENHGSGTLRKAKKLGTAYKSLYKEERIAYDFGWEFKCIPNSRITYNDAIAEGDCHSFTEACWHAERYIARNPYKEDEFNFKYLIIEEEGKKYEGIGLICRKTSANYIGDGNTVFAIIAEYDAINQCWLDAKNPF